MPVFEYTALTSEGRRTTGIVDAQSLAGAHQRLRQKGQYPVALKEISAQTATGGDRWLRWVPKLGGYDHPVGLLSRQLAALLQAGFQLVPAIDLILPHIRKRPMQRAMARVKDALVQGASFWQALEAQPAVFSSYYVHMVRSGEQAGTLATVLDQLADGIEKRQALQGRIQAALIYPAVMVTFGALVLVFLIAYVVPNIADVFEQWDAPLPLATRILLAGGNWMQAYGAWLAAVLVGFALIWMWVRQTRAVRERMARLMLRLPGISGLIRKMESARFCATLASLLKNGVPMLAAIPIAMHVIFNIVLRKQVQQVAEQVASGESLAGAMAHETRFPQMAVQMMQVGEQSGHLEQMLEKISELYQREVETSLSAATALLEPALIVGLGCVVLFVVLAVCLPIFDMNQLAL